MKPKAFVYFCGRSLANLLMGSGRVQPGLGKLATEVVIAGGAAASLESCAAASQAKPRQTMLIVKEVFLTIVLSMIKLTGGFLGRLFALFTRQPVANRFDHAVLV